MLTLTLALRNQDVLLKDSIYGAIGLSAPVLDDKVDFDAFIRSTLVSEVQINQPGYNILRRRIAIVLGQWLPIKEGLDRQLVYQIFQHLLDESDALNDNVVRITAGRQLKNVIDPFEFQPETFVSYVPTIVGRLMDLINDVELTETKLALLNTLTVIVTKLQTHVRGSKAHYKIPRVGWHMLSIFR